jgi:hypothetical protein
VAASSYLTVSTGMTAIVTLYIVGLAPVTTNGAVDGNTKSSQLHRCHFRANLGSRGASCYLRCQDANDLGNDAGLAIDDLTISITTVPEPTALGLRLSMIGVGVRRKR